MLTPAWITVFHQQHAPLTSLRDQTCNTLRHLIRNGQLLKGERLPSTRTLAKDLAISRVTAEAAYSQLEAEGYLQRKVGDGTYVAIHVMQAAGRLQPPPDNERQLLSRRGAALDRGRACADRQHTQAFAAGAPDLRAFPIETWQKLTSKRLRQDGASLMRYGDPQGYAPLRSAIAAYLSQSRGVHCQPEQVVVLTSSQQALHLIATLLLDPGDPVWMEDPGYRGAKNVFAALGASVQAVPVDAEGMNPERAPSPTIPKLIYLTPAHQFPTGVPLSLARRMHLIEYARQHRSWIVEDDYDSEFQYDSRPIPAMQGLDPHGRVLYVGTFSKVLFPSLRLAYLVLPPALVQRFTSARAIYDGHCAQLAQAVTADFLAQGHFAVHIRQMRQLYHSRRDLLVRTLGQRLPQVSPQCASAGGLLLTVRLPNGQEQRLTRAAAAAGIITPGLGDMFLEKPDTDGWMLGYSALNNAEIIEGVRRLAALDVWK
jgi:GntR family transcriptional regulator/MocR family aminotransferase